MTLRVHHQAEVTQPDRARQCRRDRQPAKPLPAIDIPARERALEARGGWLVTVAVMAERLDRLGEHLVGHPLPAGFVPLPQPFDEQPLLLFRVEFPLDLLLLAAELIDRINGDDQVFHRGVAERGRRNPTPRRHRRGGSHGAGVRLKGDFGTLLIQFNHGFAKRRVHEARSSPVAEQ